MKYVLSNETHFKIVENKEQATTLMVGSNKWTWCERVPKGKHACRSCGEIAEGKEEDVLCLDCERAFGCTYYSEL